MWTIINNRKSNVLLYNYNEGKPDEVSGMKVVSSIRYLGTDVGDSRLCEYCCLERRQEKVEKSIELLEEI